MLDVVFYRAQDLTPQSIRMSETFYEWLSRSEFSKIGRSQRIELELEGEMMAVPLVRLEEQTRKGLRQFLRDQIVTETESVLAQLDATFSKDVYGEVSYRLRKLQELRKYVENDEYAYLQRA